MGPCDSSSPDSEYFSDGGDAIAAMKRAGQKFWKKDTPDKTKKQKTRRKSAFAARVFSATGLTIEECGTMNQRIAFKCVACGTTSMNMMARWQQHAKKCKSTKHVVATQQRETPLVLHLNAANEIHRKKLVDTYAIVYWIYKHKMPFTTGTKLHEVAPPFPVVWLTNSSLISPFVMLFFDYALATAKSPLHRQGSSYKIGFVSANHCQVWYFFRKGYVVVVEFHIFFVQVRPLNCR